MKKEECLKMVRRNGLDLRHIENQDKEICLEAVKQYGCALEYVKNQDKDICLEAVRQDGNALYYVENQDKDICLEAVKQKGLALEYVKNQDREICLEAVKQNGWALRYVENSLLTSLNEELDILYLPKTGKHRDLIINKDGLCWIGCQRGITIEELVDRIYNEGGGIKENPHRQFYLDFLKENKLI